MTVPRRARVLFAAILLFLVAALPLSALADEGTDPDATYAHVQLPPLVLTGSSEQTSIIVTLEVATHKKAEAQDLVPRLLDAFQKGLLDMPASGATMMQGTMLDIRQIKACLMTAAGKVSPPGLIHDMQIDVMQGRT